MERVLLREKPNLVVYSGGKYGPNTFTSLLANSCVFSSIEDQVTGENIGSNATGYWARLVQPCLATNTPWATVFGNHGKW